MEENATITFTSVVTPSGSSVTWTVADTDVANIGGASSAEGSSCVVTGVAVGTTTLNASITVDGRVYNDTCTITVNEA